jgi:LacI family transcriptional regulator
VLNGIAGKATEETVRRVRAAAERLAYRPLAAARELRRGVAELVALLAPNLANPTMATLAAAIETALRPDGIGVVLCDTHDEVALQDEALAATRALRPRATVLLGAVASPALTRQQAEGERLLFVGRRCPHAPRAPFIGIDDRAAGRAVAAALLAAGCRRLGVVHGPLFSSATAERVEGFRAAGGPALHGRDVLGGNSLDHLLIGATAASRWRERGSRPDGIMCTSDLIALSAHRVLAGCGQDAPPIIWGFDGSPLNRWVAPWLSSVALPYAAIGGAVRDWVIADAAVPGDVILPFRLDAAPS